MCNVEVNIDTEVLHISQGPDVAFVVEPCEVFLYFRTVGQLEVDAQFRNGCLLCSAAGTQEGLESFGTLE